MEEEPHVVWKGCPPTFFQRSYKICFCIIPDDLESLDSELSRAAIVVDEERNEYPDALFKVSVAIHSDEESVPAYEKVALEHVNATNSLADTEVSKFFMVSGRRRKLLKIPAQITQPQG